MQDGRQDFWFALNVSAHELALGTLAAIDEDPVTAGTKQRC